MAQNHQDFCQGNIYTNIKQARGFGQRTELLFTSQRKPHQNTFLQITAITARIILQLYFVNIYHIYIILGFQPLLLS
jgi:hypothetical protein